jgi:hypothetical protein
MLDDWILQHQLKASVFIDGPGKQKHIIMHLIKHILFDSEIEKRLYVTRGGS